VTTVSHLCMPQLIPAQERDLFPLSVSVDRSEEFRKWRKSPKTRFENRRCWNLGSSIFKDDSTCRNDLVVFPMHELLKNFKEFCTNLWLFFKPKKQYSSASLMDKEVSNLGFFTVRVGSVLNLLLKTSPEILSENIPYNW
jgi:hypothetical protein